jgi:hypothetical protein
MEDMAELARVAQAEPMETAMRLELLRRELSEVVERDPTRVANFGLVMSHGHAMLERQLRHALLLLAQRQDAIEVLSARLVQMEHRLIQVETRRQRRPWWRWW